MAEHLISEALKKPTPEESYEIMVTALKKLAYLGNGDKLGNSEGNIIAQRALIRTGVEL